MTGRRNLPNYERARLALRLKDAVSAEAKAKKESTLKQNSTVNQKSDERYELNTNKELAKAAGVSHDTIHKVEVIEEKAAPIQGRLVWHYVNSFRISIARRRSAGEASELSRISRRALAVASRSALRWAACSRFR